ncbi:Carbamoylphosphate synthase large subunit [Planctomycetales bacterium 10988]|nr:Carbamoylphosphate synthase large subunit [Planctomycetales bacterium 10988]
MSLDVQTPDKTVSVPKRRLKILFTEASSLSARQTLYALGKQHDIDLMDSTHLAQCRFSSLRRRFFYCPNYAKDPQRFLRFLGQRLRVEQYDVLVPTHEQVYLLSKVREPLQQLVHVALPEFNAIQCLQSKANFSRLLTKLEMPQPTVRICQTKEEILQETQFPCYLKRAHSTAGNGVERIENHEELKKTVNRLVKERLIDGKAEYLVQQVAVGVQGSAQAVFQHGKLVGAHLFLSRATGVGGSAAARISAWQPIIGEHLRKLGKHLNWHGAFFLDLFYDSESGQPSYIEANPRIGETVNATLSGNNLAELLVQVSMGKELPEFNPPSGQIIQIKTHSGYMMLLHDALCGVTRRKMVSEVWNRSWSRGWYQNSEDDLTRLWDDIYSVLPMLYLHSWVLMYPPFAKQFVESTVENYSLSEKALRQIASISPSKLYRSLAGS